MNPHKHDDSSNNLSLLPSIGVYNNQSNFKIAQGYFIPKNIVRGGLQALQNLRITKHATPGLNISSTNKQNHNVSEQWTKPRLITIIKAGERPRKKISVLLNRKAIHNFEQFICDISDAFGLPRWKNDKIRRLYTIKGKRVQSISDFFRGEDIFIGVSGKQPLTMTMIKDLIDELYPNSQYAQNLSTEWEQTNKNSTDGKITQLDSGYADDDNIDNKNENRDLNDSNNYTARDSKITHADKKKKRKATFLC